MAIRQAAKKTVAKKTPAGRTKKAPAPAVKKVGPKARAAALAAKKAEALAARKAAAVAKRKAAAAKKKAPARGKAKKAKAASTQVFIKLVIATQAGGKPTEASYFGADGSIIPRSTVKAVVGNIIYHETLVAVGTVSEVKIQKGVTIYITEEGNPVIALDPSSVFVTGGGDLPVAVESDDSDEDGEEEDEDEEDADEEDEDGDDSDEDDEDADEDDEDGEEDDSDEEEDEDDEDADEDDEDGDDEDGDDDEEDEELF